MIQMVIATVLMFVLFFGIGFILNMLMKTTWFPTYGYLVLIVGLLIYWGMEEGSLLVYLQEAGLPDYLIMIGGLIGAYVSGSSIKALRTKGYKMF